MRTRILGMAETRIDCAVSAGARRKLGWSVPRRWALSAACALSVALASRGAAIDLISVGADGRSANAPSTGVAVNADGRVVAFVSDATNVVAGDTNQVRDVFVRDRTLGTNERISVGSSGAQANRASHATGGAPAISGDGQIVAFHSEATNLVGNDTNGRTDVFVRLRTSAITERVSVSTTGTQSNGTSLNPSISSDGRFVAFQSQASNLVPNDTNGVSDIFVRDRDTGTTERVCDGVLGESNGDSFTPSISADGNFVAFTSAATNLVPSDTNGRLDIFVCDRRTGSIERASVSSAGVQGNGDSILPAISGVGCIVAFKSLASNLVPNDNNGVVDVFARDRAAGTTERTSVDPFGRDANDGSFPPAIDYDGRFVAFGSAANNLVIGDVNGVPSLFVRDRQVGKTRLVDVNDRGEQANNGTPDIPPSVSGDGTQIGFVSLAFNLAGNDRNEAADVFITGNPFIETPAASSVCCQCGASCESPTLGACPADCTAVCGATCLGASCATFTPTPTTPTPTNTPSRPDCCQCTGRVPACEPPQMGACSTGCEVVFNAVCQSAGCATVTPTQSPTPTPGPPDCCQCSDGVPHCARPVDGTCPTQCGIVRSALCVGAGTPGTGNCVTFTPTPTISPATATPTGTNTPTGGTATTTGTATATGTATTTVTAPTATATASATGGTATATASATSTNTSGTATPTTTSTATSTSTGGTATPTVTPTAQCPPGTPNGTACDDGNLCTTNDRCVDGSCRGTPIDCSNGDQCHNPGMCDATTGQCTNPKPNGTPCNDSNLCTFGDQCQGGMCIGLQLDCTGDQCHNPGICDPGTGQCTNPKPNGTVCNDGNLCTTGDQCVGGACTGTPVDCSAGDQCHNAGTCDPVNGQCTNSPKPNGSPCNDGLFCTNPDTCQNGSCGGPNPCPPGQVCDETNRRCVLVPTPTKKPDDDAIGCTLTPAHSRRGAWLWLPAVAVLLLRRRRGGSRIA